ncbi:hypothetical protein [Radiobacillus sp. PE A8.2]|uniref:hypothetical protein n=1 Tax=Radiobacillus sp. PE A8.2 TaxID=3380349 RepID=UPI00389045E2
MRLTKKMYFIEEGEREIIDYDALLNPIYGDAPATEYIPLPCEIEPYSNELATTRYGVFVDATNRLFCEPNNRISLNIEITDQPNGEGNVFVVTENMKYDKHYEVLIKKD